MKGILELEGKEHPPMLLCFLLLRIELNQQAFFQKEAQVKQPHNCKHHSSPANVLSLRTLVQRICCKRNLEIRKTESKEKPYSYVRHLYRSRTHEEKKGWFQHTQMGTKYFHSSLSNWKSSTVATYEQQSV